MTEITSKDQTLLPCPFCGLRPNLIRAFNDPAWWIISCPHADCEVGPTIEREGQDAAIAAWNKRGTVETSAPHSREWRASNLLASVLAAGNEPISRTLREDIANWINNGQNGTVRGMAGCVSQRSGQDG